MPEIIITEEHDQIYQVMLERGMQDIAVAHIDFHCDMRGLMIDRSRGVAYMTSRYEDTFVDDGNFLAHAIMNGIVSSVRWVHDLHGGRRYDFVGCVKYESDVLAVGHDILHRLRRGHEVSIAFEELSFQDWDGIRPGEYLDIDWDGIASDEYQPVYIRKLMDDFLNREFPVIPATTFLVFSPDYSYDDRDMFEGFAARLEDKFAANTTRLPKPSKPVKRWPSGMSLPWQVLHLMRKNQPKLFVVWGYHFLQRLSAHNTRHDLDHSTRT